MQNLLLTHSNEYIKMQTQSNECVFREANKGRISIGESNILILNPEQKTNCKGGLTMQTKTTAGTPFQKIQDACATTGLSRYFLRNGCKDGSVPHIKSGGVYYINIPALLKKLEATQ